MPEIVKRATIPEHLMRSRLAQSEQMREFFIQMWIQNPALAKQAGVRVQAMLAPIYPNSSSTGNDGGGENERHLRFKKAIQ